MDAKTVAIVKGNSALSGDFFEPYYEARQEQIDLKEIALIDKALAALDNRDQQGFSNAIDALNSSTTYSNANANVLPGATPCRYQLGRTLGGLTECSIKFPIQSVGVTLLTLGLNKTNLFKGQRNLYRDCLVQAKAARACRQQNRVKKRTDKANSNKSIAPVLPPESPEDKQLKICLANPNAPGCGGDTNPNNSLINAKSDTTMQGSGSTATWVIVGALVIGISGLGLWYAFKR